MADTKLNIDAQNVKVVRAVAHAELVDVDVDPQSNADEVVSLNGSKVRSIGEGEKAEIEVELPCGDVVAFDASKVVSAIFAVLDN